MSSFCTYFDSHTCRSCPWIEQGYPEQIERKEAKVLETLGFFPEVPLEPSMGSLTQGFRNRVKLSVTGTLAEPIVGLLGPASELDDGRELLACPIHHPRLNELMAAMPALILKHRLVPYRIRERQGELKGLIAFHSPHSRQTYLRFILRSEECIERIRDAIPELQDRFPHLKVVSANLQPIPHAILEGPEEVYLTEKRLIEHRLGDLVLKLSPQAFVQTHVEGATQLYQAAARWIGSIRPERMLELYCGQGAFSFFAAPEVGRIQGFEIHPDAVRVANETARELGLDHVSFKQADATYVEAEILSFRPDLVLVNPPRRGLGEGIHLIERAQPAHWIYSSCDIKTLASDLKKVQNGYELKRVQLFDLFPHTEHFETLVWLQRKGAAVGSPA